jgi:hypothetical protein
MTLATSPLLACRELVCICDRNCESLPKIRRRGISFSKRLPDFKPWIKAIKYRTLKSRVCLISRFRRGIELTKVGIHGVPFREWDGVKGDGIAGYCPHNSNLFGSWHRPYLALFEQVLQSHAVKIAEEYPAGEARKNAQKVAEKIRLPYWDWAMNPPNADEGVMPAVLRQPTASITYPNGTKGSIPNPIYQYNFHPLKYEDFSILVR